jgi:sugar phosphate isomerase/epimerase
VKFDGVDLFLFDPHVRSTAERRRLQRLADKIRAKGLVVGSVVAPVWPPTGGGSAMGTAEDRKKFVEQVRKACRIAQKLRELGVRPYGIVRIDSAPAASADWAKDPRATRRTDRADLSRGCTSPRTTASGSPPRAKSAGAACTAGSAW